MIGNSKNTASRLRHRLTLQQEVQTADGAGGNTRTWQNIVDLWAEINPISGRERAFAGQVQAEISHKITIRYRSGVTAGMRLLYNTRIFNIRTILNSKENNETLELWADEGMG
jgi:SPP1 family predicted phage head-tail adaptor